MPREDVRSDYALEYVQPIGNQDYDD